MKTDLSVIIVAGNEEDSIVDCLKSVNFAKEIILVQNQATTDKTISLAKKTRPDIILINARSKEIDFSLWHNTGAKAATQPWQLHLDCDERVNLELKEEIIATINSPGKYTNFDLPRANHFLGHRVKHGGTYPDYVKRLYQTKSLISYSGTVHEQPKIIGPSSALKNDLLHYTHKDLTSMLQKSIKWTDIEARLLHESGHPPVVWWRFIRMMLTKFWERFVQQQMWRDGTVGWISVIFETFNTFMIYARLWELQQQKA
jgi:glycosyltransferase involved in cell wall biosynthesis